MPWGRSPNVVDTCGCGESCKSNLRLTWGYADSNGSQSISDRQRSIFRMYPFRLLAHHQLKCDPIHGSSPTFPNLDDSRSLEQALARTRTMTSKMFKQALNHWPLGL